MKKKLTVCVIFSWQGIIFLPGISHKKKRRFAKMSFEPSLHTCFHYVKLNIFKTHGGGGERRHKRDKETKQRGDTKTSLTLEERGLVSLNLVLEVT